MHRGRLGMGTVRSFGVHNTFHARKRKYEIRRSPHSSASLGEPRTQCCGSTPCPKARFPERHNLSNGIDDMNS